MHIMAQNRLPLGSNISHFVSNVGRRARRMDAEFRHFFEDPAFGLGPLRPGTVADAAKRFVAKPAMPVDGTDNKVSVSGPGWTWEDELEAKRLESVTIAKAHEAASFQDRFPAANKSVDATVVAEPPSPAASHYWDVYEQRSSEQPLEANAIMAVPVGGSVASVSTDPLLSDTRASAQRMMPDVSSAQPNDTETTSDDLATEIGDASALDVLQSVDHGGDLPPMDVGALKAFAPDASSTPDSKVSAELNRPHKWLHVLRERFSTMSLMQSKTIDNIRAQLNVRTARSLFMRNAMKTQELPDNSLLEIDAGHEGLNGSNSIDTMSSSEAGVLKRQVGKHSVLIGEGLSGNGVVGAVKLTENSPMPRTGNESSVIKNPIVHGKGGEGDTYKVEVTHEAPAETSSRQPLRLAVNLRAKAFGLVIRGLLALVGLVILAILGWIGYSAFTGNVPPPTPIATPAEPSTVVTPTPLVPLPTPTAPSLVASVGLSEAEIYEAEDLLAQLLILDEAAVDGVADEATMVALRQFEREMGYEPTDGVLTRSNFGDVRGMALIFGIFPR